MKNISLCSYIKHVAAALISFLHKSLLICSLYFFVSCSGNLGKSNYQIKGKLSNSKGETISLVDVNSSQVKTLDSVKVNEKGEFVFTKKVPEKGFYIIQIIPSNYATIIADS